MQWQAREGGGRLVLLRMAALGTPHRRRLPRAAWKKATASKKPGLAPKPAGLGTSGVCEEPCEVVSKAGVIPEMCPRGTHVTTSTATSLVQILPLT